jgi:hypothetical protein
MQTFLIQKTLVPLPSTSKNFTLFEIVNKLVSKEEPLYFNPPPPHLARMIAQPKSKNRGTPDSKGNATWCDKLVY